MQASVLTTSPPTRRNFLRLAGGGLLLSAGAAPLAGCSSALPAEAVQAWQAAADQSADVRHFALAHALLAPNPHNRQPWIADLRRDAEITLFNDLQRQLPETDPHGRQILIGHGCFLELLVIAAAERGQRAEITLFPEGAPSLMTLDPRPVARVVLQADSGLARDPLFAMIRRRHTHKGRYAEGRALPAQQWAAVEAACASPLLTAGHVEDAAQRAALSKIALEAYQIEGLTPRTHLESARLFRIGPSEIALHRDGISINGLMPRAMLAVGMFDRMEIPAPGNTVMKQMMKRWADFETGSGYLWIAARDTSRAAQVAAGRAYVRAHLAATAAGLDMHPLSQALQEFAEVRGPYEAMHRRLGLDPARTPLQMLARVGYGEGAAAATPRRGLAALLQPASGS